MTNKEAFQALYNEITPIMPVPTHEEAIFAFHYLQRQIQQKRKQYENDYVDPEKNLNKYFISDDQLMELFQLIRYTKYEFDKLDALNDE